MVVFVFFTLQIGENILFFLHLQNPKIFVSGVLPLFISYMFIKRLFAITLRFLFFAISSWNLYNMCQLFYLLRNKISVGSDKKWKISPYTPYVKFTHFGNFMPIDITWPKWRYLQWGSIGKFYVFGQIQLKFRFWVYAKRWNI